MPSTPEPTSMRVRTPPTPLHGPQYEQYQPYSPRRSTRTTTQNNPYSSLKSDRSPRATSDRNVTPPPTAKRARFARTVTHLSSPPSSPASPAQYRSAQRIHKTPRKGLSSSRKVANSALSDSEHTSSSLAPHSVDRNNMLPTPSKTPSKRNTTALNSTARILSFQPNNPNDVMPSPRRIKKHGRVNSMSGFELYDEEREARREQVDIYTDANARVPEMDVGDDNPFIGTKQSVSRPQRRGRRAPTTEADDMEEAARREEGVVYVFRGKKIFRRFSDPEDERSSSAATETSDVPGQRTLRRQAGAAAHRPLTRSAIKPRLLFPSEDQLLEREQGLDDIDEEAVTDIDMPNGPSPVKQKGKVHELQTPTKSRLRLSTPPTTGHATRSVTKKATPAPGTPSYDNETEPMSVGTDETYPARRSAKSPFDTWQRTKHGKKRAGDVAESSAKRTRSNAVIGSPA